VASSLLPFNVEKSGSKELNEFLPSEVVKFTRSIKIGEEEEKLISENPQEEILPIDYVFSNVVSIRCLGELDPHFLNSTEAKDLQTSWISDDGSILSPNDTIVIESISKKLKARCQAEISGIADIQDGTVLSRSIEFRKKPYEAVDVEPRIFHTTSNAAARLVCRWLPDLASDVIWKKNGEIIQNSKNLQIETINGKSLLHILKVDKENSGEYRCELSGKDLFGEGQIIIDESAPEWTGVELEETSGGPTGGQTLLECLLPGSEKITWTLERSSKKEFNSETVTIGNNSILLLKDISKELNGKITCTVELNNGVKIKMETDFKALEPESFDYSKSSFTTITKKQGMATSFRCETYDLLGETPEMATWYLNSKPVSKSPYVKTVSSSQYGIGYTDLLIGIIEEEHGGLYTCIVQGPHQERIKQVEFIVDVTTNQTITNLTVITDHKEKCIELEFDLPEKTELSWAHFTTYFVVFYKVNDSESLNSLPGGAVCNYGGHCHLKDSICNINGEFEEATDYVFRISMVLSGAGTVITPLSVPVIGRTWDGAARKSLPLEMIYLEDENAIEIKWEKPKKEEIKGRVTSYVVQVMNYSEKMTSLLSPVMKEYYEKDSYDRSFRVENLTKPFAYKFRVTPLTRSGKLPFEEMSLIENFPFLLFTSSDDGSSQVDYTIPAPEMTLRQKNLHPIILAFWQDPKESQDEINKVIIRYQHILNPRSKFILAEFPVEGGKAEITKSIESGYVYQVCASFMKRSDKVHGPWKCATVPIKTHQSNLIFLTEKEAIKKKQLPFPINCNETICKCSPSEISAGGMRIEWEEPLPEAEAEYFVKEKPKVNYFVHYTFDENNTKEENREINVKEGNLFVETPPLLPNKTYRIMIKAFNEIGDGVEGTYFSCTTPSETPLLPPRDLSYTSLNSSHIRLNWTSPSFHDDSLVDGYIILVQKGKNGSKSERIFVEDSKIQSYVVGKLRPGKNYYFSMFSHSPIFGDSRMRSEILQVKLPEDKDGYIGEGDLDDDEDEKRKSTLYNITFYSAVVTVTLLMIFIVTSCCYFCCFVRLRQWRGRQEQERIQRMRSNASSALTLKSEDSRDLELEAPPISATREILPLLNLPPDPPGFEDLSKKDTKGPVGGPRPLGNKKFRRLMKDPEFLERIAELNRDPTGIGLPALMRDQYYMELQKESDKKFREVAAREWEEIRKSKKVSEEKRKKMEKPKKSIAETSFINTTSPPTSLKDEFIRTPESKNSPTSVSMTELNNKQQSGLTLRSQSIAFYQKFFPFRKPSFLTKFTEVKNLSPTNTGTSNHPPASSLPNLTDSGIVFDDHNGYNGTHSNHISKSGDRSGSTTLVDEAVTPPASRAFYSNMRDCRRQKNMNECLDGTGATTPTLVP